jgi:hypothetical protein
MTSIVVQELQFKEKDMGKCFEDEELLSFAPFVVSFVIVLHQTGGHAVVQWLRH